MASTWRRLLLEGDVVGGTLQDSDTVLLIKSHNDDGSKDFVDSSSAIHPVLYEGDIHHETDHFKYGKSSIHVDGAGDYLDLADNAGWQFNERDFTIDFWAKGTETSDTRGFINYFKDANNRWHLTNYSKLQFYTVVGGSAIEDLSSTTPARDTNWHHYAVVRYGNTIQVYVDGVSYISDSFTQNMNVTGGRLYIGVRTDNGSDYSTYSSELYMDEIRISSIARWTSDFLPPSTSNYEGSLTGIASLGIGTASPDSTLHVHTATAGTWGAPAYGDDLVIESDGDTGMSIVSPDADDSYIVFSSPSRTGSYNALIYSAYSSGSEFLAMNTYQGGETMRLTHEGRVGIKTSNPQRTLSVGSGDLQVWDGSDDSNIFIGQGNTVASPTYEHSVKTTAAGLFQIRRHHGTATNVFTIATDNAATFAGAVDIGGRFKFVGGGQGPDIDTTSGGLHLSSVGGDVYCYDGATAHSFWVYNGGTGSVKLNSNGDSFFNGGNVGIGATPLYPLHVNTSTDKNLMVRDSVAPTGGVMLQSVNDADSAATAMELRGSLFSFQVGNVGIGQESPAEILDIGANTNADNVGYAIRLHESDTKSWDIQTTGGATSAERGLQFEQSQGGVAMTIRGDGKVGIGTSAPAGLMELSSTSSHALTYITAKTDATYTPQIQFRTGATPSVKFSMGIEAVNHADAGKFKIASQEGMIGTSEFVIDTAGNVGIGTTSPQTPLEVQGHLRIDPDSGSAMIDMYTGGTRRHEIVADTSGNLEIRPQGSSSNATKWDSSGNATFAGSISTGTNGNIDVGDNKAFRAGNGSDLQLYHNASHSIIENSTGDIRISNDATGGTLKLYTESTLALTLDTSQNATFAGGVFIRQGSDIGCYFDATNTNTLNTAYHDDSDNHGFWINYKGYQGGTTRFRDFYVGDGKQGQVAKFTGSDKSATFTGNVTANSGTASTHIFGLGKIGSPWSSYAAFGHKDKVTTTAYAFLQHSSGWTGINAETGDYVAFRINNTGPGIYSDVMKMTADGLTINGSLSLNSILDLADNVTAPNVTDSYVTLLIHSDHADDSTDIVDSSSRGYDIGITNDVIHSTDHQYFGASSLWFDGATDGLWINDGVNDGWAFGTDDFTIDFWHRRTATTDWGTFAESYSYATPGFICGYHGTTNKLAFYSEGTSTWNYDSSSTTLAVDTWYHIAFVRNGTSLKIYLNGVADSSFTLHATNDTYLAGQINIGSRNNGADDIEGYMDEVRISKGVARWTADFTPPVKPYSSASAFAIKDSSGENGSAYFMQKVGIGTDSPASILELEGTSPRLTIDGASGNDPGIDFSEGGTQRFSIYWDGSEDSLKFRDYGTADRVTITEAGKVGINETTPEVKLEIVGAGRFTSEGAATNPSTGKGMELQYATSNRAQGEGSYIISYDRSNSAYKQFVIDAEPVILANSGGTAMTLSSNNATFAGDILIDKPSGGNITIDSGGGDGYLQFKNASSVRWSIGRDNTDNALVFNYGDGLGSSGGQLKLAPTSGNATFAGKVGIDSGGYTQKQLHIGDEGQMLLSHGSDTSGEYSGIYFRSESDEENGMGRTKGLIAFERTGAYGVGDMKFCVENTANNDTVDNSDVALTIASDKNATFAGSITATHYNGAYITNGNIGDANSGGTQKFGGNGRTHWGGHMLSYGGNAGGKVEFNTGTSGTGTLALTIDSSQNTHFKGNIYIDKADGQFFLQNGNGANRAYIQYQESADDLIISSLEAGSDIKFLPAGNTALTLYDDLSATFAGHVDLQSTADIGNSSLGSPYLRMNGRLGLKQSGWLTPNHVFHVEGDSNYLAYIKQTGTNIHVMALRGGSTGLDFHMDSANNQARINSVGSDDSLIFEVADGTDALTFSSTGHATFAKTITANGEHHDIQNTGGNANLYIKASNSGNSRLYFGDVADAGVGFIDYDHGTSMTIGAGGAVGLTLAEADNNATFAGKIALGGGSPNTTNQLMHIKGAAGTDKYAALIENTSSDGFGVYIHAASGTRSALHVRDYSVGTDLFSVKGNGNATFAGNVNVDGRIRLGGASDNADYAIHTKTVNGDGSAGGFFSNKSNTGYQMFGVYANAELNTASPANASIAYGLFANASGGTSKNWSIYTGTANSYFGGKVGINKEPAYTFEVGGSSEGSFMMEPFGQGCYGWVDNSEEERFYMAAFDGTYSGSYGGMVPADYGVLYSYLPTGIMIGTEGDTKIQFRTNNSERLTIKGGGNVGIGCTNPDMNLTVLNAMRVRNGNDTDSNYMNMTQHVLEMHRANGSGTLLEIRTVADGNNFGNGSEPYAGSIQLNPNDTYGIYVSGGADAQSSVHGFVGIGTRDVTNRLHIKENTVATSLCGMRIEQDGAGDAQLLFDVTALGWIIGIDNDGGDSFNISKGNDLSYDIGLKIDSSLNATFAGTITANNGYVYYGTGGEYIYSNNTHLYIVSTDDLNLNVAGNTTIDTAYDINLDSDQGNTYFKDGGTQYGALKNSSGNLIIQSGSTTMLTGSGANATFAGDVTAYSDTRLKENINTIDSALDKVVKMRGVTFDRIEDGKSGAGVLADELESIAPELVHDGEYKSVAYGNLTSYLIEAIKELKQEVEVLRGSAS